MLYAAILLPTTFLCTRGAPRVTPTSNPRDRGNIRQNTRTRAACLTRPAAALATARPAAAPPLTPRWLPCPWPLWLRPGPRRSPRARRCQTAAPGSPCRTGDHPFRYPTPYTVHRHRAPARPARRADSCHSLLHEDTNQGTRCLGPKPTSGWRHGTVPHSFLSLRTYPASEP